MNYIKDMKSKEQQSLLGFHVPAYKYLAAVPFCLLASSFSPLQAEASPATHRVADATPVRSIRQVENVEVNTPVGTAPRLPYQLWVTYTDGKAE